MNDFLDIIRQRRSVRKYENREIPEETLNQVLEAVRWAPSWANTQCWELIIVKDRGLREKVQGAFPQGNPGTKAVIDAPVLVALCGKLKTSGFYKDVVTTKFGDWFMFDLGLAAQNLCLAAHALGLGTVMLGMFDHGKVRETLSVPEGYEVVALIPMGYPAKTPTAPNRKEIDAFVHYDRF
jgi:nitroreductase